MLFTQPIFFVFFAIVLTVVWTSRQNHHRKAALLAASYVFYAAWDWRFLSLIVASTLVDYMAVNGMKQCRLETSRRRWLQLSLVFNLGMLGFFKYFNFFVGHRVLEIVLPVGISFFTFQTMSYTIDVYRRRLEPAENWLDFALFVGFFPQLVAGPIVRAAHFLPQLERSPSFSSIQTRRFLTLFLVGFVKKTCIADNVAPYVDQVFADPGIFTAASVWIAVTFYAVQIYCDFSGYTDMAIACAGLLGYDLGRNFRFPYLASDLTEFWRRWHISLSAWLRDYLYIPLGGSRGSRLWTYRNLLLTMLLGGLWHGAAWTFVAWGGLHGAGLVLHKEWTRRSAHLHRIRGTLAFKLLGTAMTFYFVCCAWIFFRAQSFGDAAVLLKAFVWLDTGGTVALDMHLFAALLTLGLLHWISSQARLERFLDRLSGGSFAAGYGMATALALAFVPMRSAPFIYFQF